MLARSALASSAALAIMATPAGAQAAPADHVLVSDTATLQTGDHATTVTVSLINLTDSDADVVITGVGQPECRAEPSTLLAGRQQSLTVKLTGCTGESLPLTVAVGDSRFTVTASPAAAPSPDWWILWFFPVAAVVALVVIGRLYRAWAKVNTGGLRQLLPGLTDKWTFKDAVAGNLVVVAAAFTGVFATSDVIEALFGDKTQPILALGTVASAIAVGIAGAGPLLLQAAREGEHMNVTVFGLLAAGAMTLAATGGELAVILYAALHLDLGTAGRVAVGILGLAAVVLLIFYADRSLHQNLVAGKRRPEEVSAALKDAALKIDAAVRAGGMTPQAAQSQLAGALAGSGTPAATPEIEQAAQEVRQAVDQEQTTYPQAFAELFPAPPADRPSAYI